MAFAARPLSLMVSSASLAESWTVCCQGCTMRSSHGQVMARSVSIFTRQPGSTHVLRIRITFVLQIVETGPPRWADKPRTRAGWTLPPIGSRVASFASWVPRTKSAPCIVSASVGAWEIGSTNGYGDYRADNVKYTKYIKGKITSIRKRKGFPFLSKLVAASLSPEVGSLSLLLDTAAVGPGHGLHTDVRVCPSAHTGRPWPSVSTHRTSGCPSVHISARSVDCSGDFGPRGLSVQYTQDVRQHTQDVRGCPCVSVCPSVHTGRPSAHAGRPSAHAGRPWLSVCLRVSVSAHRTSVSTHRTSVSTRRTSVSTRRTSVAVRVCPCVRQCTQDVRQHTQDVRQHTQDVRGCPCVSVCPSAHAGRPSAHAGRPSAHAGRPCLSVSTHRLSVD
ncbi:hypothetical protein YC2023_003301 [Brassica napus]